ncbi:uncharacterized protein LY89DRAFT_184039 [Mollisia scopiformis]|uniref:Uncharacterized protein n=1 Tax=Mollisia scopiformis TaxID=149040 RepID=A0A194XT63_MOLSC|nr:uncharacterized protein LY89DRAFT_184039 [Mollisia scopiformis]KUJ23500.1 hypothetical protein LY89DRAFT_184039 [Mollisia scopiformis]
MFLAIMKLNIQGSYSPPSMANTIYSLVLGLLFVNLLHRITRNPSKRDTIRLSSSNALLDLPPGHKLQTTILNHPPSSIPIPQKFQTNPHPRYRQPGLALLLPINQSLRPDTKY